jgi:hypothetical protein
MTVLIDYTEGVIQNAAIDRIILRLADEAVPIMVIARAVERPSDDIRLMVQEAIDCGTVLAMPRPDWHPLPRGGRPPPSRLTDEELVINCQRAFGLARLQASFMSLLMRRNEVTKAALHLVIESCRRPNQKFETDIKMVDVVICHLRKRLRPYGLKVDTLWSSGYYMAPNMRNRAQDLMVAVLNGEPNGQDKGEEEQKGPFPSVPKSPGDRSTGSFDGEVSADQREGNDGGAGEPGDTGAV